MNYDNILGVEEKMKSSPSETYYIHMNYVLYLYEYEENFSLYSGIDDIESKQKRILIQDH